MSSETYHCWYPVQIRFRDLDPLAHVNNTVYFVYLEEARSFYFDQLQPWRHADETPVQEESDEQHNPRINSLAREIPRGTIYDRTGIPLATSDWRELERQAGLPQVLERRSFCHL